MSQGLAPRLLLLVAAIVGLMAVPLAVNPNVHLRADAMSNTALAHAVRRHGIPPRDPYLAGQPLHYHWAYNAAAAGLSALSGLEPLTVMVWLGPLGLGVMLLGVARLARWLGAGQRGAALAVVLAVVGLNGWGWLILAARWMGGQVGVAESLSRDVSDFLLSVVHGYDMRIGFLATKALLATPYIWTLAALPFAVDAMLRWVRGARWPHAVAAVVAGALAAYANLLVGTALLGLLAAGLVLWAWAHRRADGGRATRRALAGLGLVAASALLVLPYVAVAVGQAAQREALVTLGWPDAWHLRGLVVGLLPLWACVGLLGLRGRAGGRWVLVLAGAFAAAFLVVRAVDEVHVKFLSMIAVLLSVYVGHRSAGLARWRRVALWVAAATAAPTTLLGVVDHVLAPDVVRVSEGERGVFAWIAEHTPQDTVVVADGRSTLVPILARRDLYVPDRVGFHRAGRYDPAVWARRSARMRRLYKEGEVVPVLRAITEEMGRPVVLITRTPFLRPRDPRLRLLRAAGTLRAWALEEERRLPPGAGAHAEAAR
ncbi:MAG: hypothetical protein ACLF0G_15040 [Candidatus Brocadiia bacterium]